MLPELQPQLQNESVKLRPLASADFEILYAVASDPLIWEQHPNQDRYKREVFQNFFEGAMASGGAFLVYDAVTDKPIGSSRFYEYNEKNSSIAIGYTFLARDHWGTTYNRALKTIMLDHAFTFVNKVIFHIGAKNIRSQTAIQRLGAIKVDEQDIAYHGESSNPNFVYCINKSGWKK
jgi:RimJ/RimL family protein N-acetyltransferase